VWTDADREAFAANMTVLAETLGEPMTMGRIAGYCAALEDVNPECLHFGLSRAMRECKFFPKPVELRELGEQAPAWRRLQDARRGELEARQVKALGPGLTDEQIQANIAKLKAVVKGLAYKRRMR
jgi:hypothetical protein